MLTKHVLKFELEDIEWRGSPDNYWILTYNIISSEIDPVVFNGILSKLEDYHFPPHIFHSIVLHPYIFDRKIIVEIIGNIQYDEEQTEIINKELKEILEDIANTIYDFLYTEGMFLAALEPAYYREEYLTEATAFEIKEIDGKPTIVIDVGADKWKEIIDELDDAGMLEDTVGFGEFVSLIRLKEGTSRKKILETLRKIFE